MWSLFPWRWSPKKIDVTAELIITDKDGNETPHTQEGKVQLSEDGRVSWVDSKPLMALSDVVVRIVNDMYSSFERNGAEEGFCTVFACRAVNGAV